jgi:hypothetical protein
MSDCGESYGVEKGTNLSSFPTLCVLPTVSSTYNQILMSFSLSPEIYSLLFFPFLWPFPNMPLLVLTRGLCPYSSVFTSTFICASSVSHVP